MAIVFYPFFYSARAEKRSAIIISTIRPLVAVIHARGWGMNKKIRMKSCGSRNSVFHLSDRIRYTMFGIEIGL
ncbi:MAG: hypothetical protein C4527_17795 [Candidatus Omnitrophota bacterium]|nr:MAG: hypothetical protein C4527_17795 [Candidatus Omnitrophota bacterium]